MSKVLDPNFVNTFAKQCHGKAFAVAGGDCLFLVVKSPTEYLPGNQPRADGRLARG
jgi:hypothetical protein